MIGNLPSQSDKEEDSRFLLLALGEGISDYIQGAAYARNSGGGVDALTKDLLDFDTSVQNFAAGGEVSLKSGLGVTEENPINFPFDDPSGDPNVVQVGTVKPISSVLQEEGTIGEDEGIDAGVNTLGGTVAGVISGLIGLSETGLVANLGRTFGFNPDTSAAKAQLNTIADENYYISEPLGKAAFASRDNIEMDDVNSVAPDPSDQAMANIEMDDAISVAADDANAAAQAAGEVGSSVGPDASGDTSNTADDDGVAGGTSDGPGDSGVGDSGVGDSGDDGTGEWKRGGVIKGYQEGALVEDEQADTQLDALGLGPVGLVDDPDGTTGVADDLAMDLPVNSYVVNKDAATLAGLGSINKLIKDAIDLALEDEVDLPAEIKTAEKIPIRISRGEIVIPAPLVDYIGLKKLENMNNRGLKVRKQREAEEAPVEMAAAPSPQQDLLAQIQPVA